MQKQKPIKVNLNRKNTEKRSPRESLHDEHAASAENKDEQLGVLQRSYETDRKPALFSGQKRFLKHARPVIMASISAIGVGVCIGIIMFNLFVGMDDGQGPPNPVPAATNDPDEERKEEDAAEKDGTVAASDVAVEPMNAYVLQGGVYSEEDNAADMIAAFEASGFPTLLWEREGTHYLFVGIARTNEQAEQLAKEADDTLEIYVKEWKTSQSVIELEEDDGRFMQSIQEQWEASLGAIGQEGVDLDAWEATWSEYSPENDTLGEFHDEIDNFWDTLEGEDQAAGQDLLLTVWQQMEQSIIN